LGQRIYELSVCSACLFDVSFGQFLPPMVGRNALVEVKLEEEPGLIRCLPPHRRQPPSLP
jgi:hypothetical protein